MSENIEPTDDATELPADETPEVEAHSSVLDKQGLGSDAPGVSSNCVSLVSVVEK